MLLKLYLGWGPNDGPALPPDEHFLKTQLAVRH